MHEEQLSKETLNQKKITIPQRIRLWIAPVLRNECTTSGKKIIDFLHKIYHSSSGVLEIIGYPSPRRHKEYLSHLINKESIDNADPKILVLGAMSPSSVGDILEIVGNGRFNNPELTVIDICRTPLASAKTLLIEIAAKLNIKLNLVQSNIYSLPFKHDQYDLVLGDQVLNFIDPKDWISILNNLLNITSPNGKIVNIIATYKNILPYYGKRSESYLANIENNFALTKRKILKLFQLSYVGITGIINNQVTLEITKPVISANTKP